MCNRRAKVDRLIELTPGSAQRRVPTMDENEARAERVYAAAIKTLDDVGMLTLLSAANEAKTKVSWDKAGPKTREVFRCLAANLTALDPKA